MKANKLMTGDYVRHKHTKQIIWIFEIDSDRGVIDNEPDGYCNETNIPIDDIEPIPLTTEILEKNGFGIDDSFRPHHFWRSADNRVILYNDDEYLNTFNKWHVRVDTEDMRTIGSIELTYVHQLQQFLRLCGLDDVANNFKV